MNNRSPLSLHVGAEEDRCAEDALESGDQSSVLCPALLHTEGIKHLRRASKLNRLALLTYCQRCQEDRNQAVLSPRETVRRMACHLKRELAIASLMEKLAGSGLLDRQSAEHEWSGRKPQVLIRLLTFQTDAGDGLCAPKFLFGDDQVAGKAAKNRPGRLKPVVLVRSRWSRTTVIYCSNAHLAATSPEIPASPQGEAFRWANRKLKQNPSRYCD